MSPHRIAYERLITYAANELTVTESARVRLHVLGCVECAATLNCFNFVRAVLCMDDTQLPPPVTLARAHALFAHLRFVPGRNGLGLN